MISWAYFPRSDQAPDMIRQAVAVFEAIEHQVGSAKLSLKSNDVLTAVRPGLRELGFLVEEGTHGDGKIKVPVLYGRNGAVAKSFDADAHHVLARVVLEVEAGRAYRNNQFLKDLFQACMMHDVDYLAVAVRMIYKGGKDFETVVQFFETLYASNRLQLPLKGIAIIGY